MENHIIGECDQKRTTFDREAERKGRMVAKS